MSAIQDMVRGYFRRSIVKNIHEMEKTTGITDLSKQAIKTINLTRTISRLYYLKINGDERLKKVISWS